MQHWRLPLAAPTPGASAWVWLLVAALLLRSALAPGVMPRVTDDGIAVVLCTASGAKTVWLNPEGSSNAHQTDTCAYGLALGMAGLPSFGAPLFLPPAARSVIPQPGRATAAVRHDPPRARGPPSPA